MVSSRHCDTNYGRLVTLWNNFEDKNQALFVRALLQWPWGPKSPLLTKQLLRRQEFEAENLHEVWDGKRDEVTEREGGRVKINK